jgi:hypothetical protein
MEDDERGNREPLLPTPHGSPRRHSSGGSGGGERSSGSSAPHANYQAITTPDQVGIYTAAYNPHYSHNDAGSGRKARLHRGLSYCESMEHQPVTLSWENVNVFVRQKKKAAKGDRTDDAVAVENGRVTIVDPNTGQLKNGSVPSSNDYVKNGRKQIINNGECFTCINPLCIISFKIHEI